MAKLGVCAELFFADRPYEERIERIARLGFRSYELWFPEARFDGARLYAEPKNFSALAECNERFGIGCSDLVLNHPDGAVVASLIDKRDRPRLVGELGRVIELGRRVGCRMLISAVGNRVPGMRDEEAINSMIETLRALAPTCEHEGVTIVVEPFNTKVDHPNYFLDDPYTCVRVLQQVDSPNIKMLYDVYHMQIMSGNIAGFLREHIGHVGHVHVAGVPGRHEPSPGELDYRFIVGELDRLGYTGAVGLEYWPTIAPDESLERARRALVG